MRLCGISSRFQLLSPCTGQVTHALLTRPPLSHQSIIRRISKGASFDLHVLGTPPAFILSQDQTLKINSSNLYRQRYIFATASDTSVAQINLITCSDYHYLNIWLGLLVSIL